MFQLRKRAREAIEPAFADPIERLEQIHSFRLAAEDDGLRLSVTYDFGWETYMRALWSEGGPFLDLLCCHCEGYKLSRETPLDEWQRWISDNQIRSDYFYSATALTVGDLAALTQSERLQRDEADPARADRCLAGLCSLSAVELAEAKRLRAETEAQGQAVRTIFAMHRLTRFWTADVAKSVIREDAITLIRATRALIENSFIEPDSLNSYHEKVFKSQLDWYRQNIDKSEQKPAEVVLDRSHIQRGILKGFDRTGKPITHGAVAFLAVKRGQNEEESEQEKARARLSLAKLAAEIASEAGEPPVGGVFRNLAFTYPGLERIGVAHKILETAPPAFRDGAAARAGSVGDLRSFHPSNWRLLRRNLQPDPDWQVELGLVDVLVQLRVATGERPADIGDDDHPLHDEIVRLAELPGLELLAVEGLAPAVQPGSDVDHLGFRDGLSQPTLDGSDQQRPWSDKVEPGALLVGRKGQQSGDFWLDGSYLAVRRMTIDRACFDALLASDSQPGLKDPALLAAKLLGRRQDGTRLGSGRTGNNFVFDGDEAGAVCPLDSHIRRANPRRDGTPRIMRRGMSFGPRVSDRPDGAERGSFFMAYCGDLAEQYERILGWVNGGNSTRTGSYLADPLTGVPEQPGRTYRFLHDGAVQRLTLPDPDHGAIGLSWSLYLFAPSLPALRALETFAAPPPNPETGLAKRGEELIAKLEHADAETWRAVLNEPAARDDGEAKAIWAAIRAKYGILETPVGYLVGRYDLVLEVLRDKGARFSNRGAGQRMDLTIGEFHLGLDPNTARYTELSEPANKALRSVREEQAFEETRGATKAVIARILDSAEEVREQEPTIDLLANLIEPVLALLASKWFDVPDGTHILSGAHDWTSPGPRAPRYPGDFWNPSRHAFNPFESRETKRMAVAEGKATVKAVENFITAVGRDALDCVVSKQMADAPAYPKDEDLARALVGCMIGGVPTVAGNLVRLLVEGLERGELDRAQWPWLMIPPAGRKFGAARKIFGPEIEKLLARAPVPEVLWREVAEDGVTLGDKTLKKRDKIIFSLESAGRDRLAQGVVDNYIPYGMAPPESDEQTPHGCPGREMANGTMLGLLVGLLESARFRPAARGMAALRPLA